MLKGSHNGGEKLHDRHHELFYQILEIGIDLFDTEFVSVWGHIYEFLNQFLIYLMKEPTVSDDIILLLTHIVSIIIWWVEFPDHFTFQYT